MGKFSTLRYFLKSTRPNKYDYNLKDCSVVIEGDSFFLQQYKESKLNFLLGGEYDRYADYLKNIMKSLIQNNVTCYVVFTGGMEADIEKRKEIHQTIINNRHNIKPGDDIYYCPIFTRNAARQVFDELGIRYCVSEYNVRQTLLELSRKLKCPVITYNFEQCLLGMTCIHPGSIRFGNSITCMIQTPESIKEHIRINDKMLPIFLTILDQNLPLYDKIPEIIGWNPKYPVDVRRLLKWIKSQDNRIESALGGLHKLLITQEEKKMFRKSFNELKNMIFHEEESSVLRYLKREQDAVLSSEKEWFRNGVITGKIPSVYVNLKYKDMFSGSWVLFEETKRDALWPSLDIVMYAHSLLWDSPRSLAFIGRKELNVDVTLVQPKYLGSLKEGRNEGNFENFIEDILPGFDWSLLKPVPEDSWLLIVSLVFHVSKAGRCFMTEASSILLSYVMLGPVSEKVGLLRRENIESHRMESGDHDNKICTYKDCCEAAKAMIAYFDEGDIKSTFDRDILHDLAEFQHCLQNVNYLNQLCGNIRGTVYHKTYNGTFVFNIILQLKKDDDQTLFFENNLRASRSVLSFYKSLKEVFDSLLSATKLY